MKEIDYLAQYGSENYGKTSQDNDQTEVKFCETDIRTLGGLAIVIDGNSMLRTVFEARYASIKKGYLEEEVYQWTHY